MGREPVREYKFYYKFIDKFYPYPFCVFQLFFAIFNFFFCAKNGLKRQKGLKQQKHINLTIRYSHIIPTGPYFKYFFSLIIGRQLIATEAIQVIAILFTI